MPDRLTPGQKTPDSQVLEELVVQNLGLIDEVSVEFSHGLTVVTGETGTGKTLMLGALRLLMGGQAAKGMIGPHAESIDVSARLVSADEETTLRRTVNRDRSRAYVDGAVATAGALADVTADVVAIVGQHDQHTITANQGIRSLVDRKLDAKGAKARTNYDSVWHTYTLVLAEADELGGDLRALEREAEMLDFQISEIATAGFEVGEEASLQSAAAKLRSAESLASDVGTALASLGDDGAMESLDRAARSLGRASEIDSSLSEAVESVESAIRILSESAGELHRYTDDLASGTHDLDTVEARLALLGDLKRKYGDSIEDILTFHKDAAARAGTLRNLLTAAGDIEERVAAAHAGVTKAAGALMSHRQAAASSVASAATTHLKDLGFTDPVIHIDLSPADPGPHGGNSTSLLFASDGSLKPTAASAVASGGELSRLVLALTLAAGGADASVVAFDEIDAGIGGTTARAMGAKLATLARDRQVICVTHLPQVAAHGDRHLVVTREGTVASVSEVDGSDRVEEIARMLAGLGESDTAQQHASELLARSGTGV